MPFRPLPTSEPQASPGQTVFQPLLQAVPQPCGTSLQPSLGMAVMAPPGERSGTMLFPAPASQGRSRGTTWPSKTCNQSQRAPAAAQSDLEPGTPSWMPLGEHRRVWLPAPSAARPQATRFVSCTSLNAAAATQTASVSAVPAEGGACTRAGAAPHRERGCPGGQAQQGSPWALSLGFRSAPVK